MKIPKLSGVAVSLALTAAACGGAADEPAVDSAASEPQTTEAAAADTSASADPVNVPAVLEFSAQTVAGGQFDAGDLAGQDTVLWFWAPW